MPQSPGAIRASVLVTLAALSTLAVGVAILVGGEARFSGPSFATSRHLAPWWAWGSAMVASGGLATTGAFAHLMWLARIGHTMSSFVYLFLVVTFIDGAIKAPTAALTGIGIYSGFALIHAWTAASADLEKTTRNANKTTKEVHDRYDAAMRDE